MIKELLKEAITRKVLSDIEIATKIELFLIAGKLNESDKEELSNMMETYPEVAIDELPKTNIQLLKEENIMLRNELAYLNQWMCDFMDFIFSAFPELA